MNTTIRVLRYFLEIVKMKRMWHQILRERRLVRNIDYAYEAEVKRLRSIRELNVPNEDALADTKIRRGSKSYTLPEFVALGSYTVT